ncbi:MAG: flavodoxin-dependent (E)-4-hydroxy-3-methylbut-2-enyl-diphosphate synthase, partial [Pelosinus sp.]|nr:flavodoxin-dependent (E)-4-hydroxy-3-methylbut-2-enyl-diphosphate synthase [Pelosinus sp.]
MRKQTRLIHIGKVPIGGLMPISVQSMTNTKTDNVPETVAQIKALMAAGCDIVRCAVPDMNAATALKHIKEAVPEAALVADIHFDYRLALAAIESGVDALRLNPGNIGSKENVIAVVKAAQKHQIPIRIGVNAGSLDKTLLEKYGGQPTPEAMVESALQHV